MRIAGVTSVFLVALFALCAGGVHAQQGVLHVVDGVTDAGDATAQWLAMLRRRLADAPFDSVTLIRRPFTAEENAWAVRIRARQAAWEQELAVLGQPFQPVRAPRRVDIVLGNRGGNDGFTHDPTTIGFDLASLVAQYGKAEESEDLIDRLFRHEYAHLLQKARYPDHPYDMSTPLRYALAEIWAEGIGNWYSMSERWRAAGGTPSAHAAKTLAVLEPRFVARIAGLACAAPERATALTADLSWGRFDRKWGALTPALWLEAEASVSDQALRAFIAAGPDGVWDLAARHVPEALRAVLTEARAAEELCSAQAVTPSSP